MARKINVDDARCDLIDALADLAHCIADADGVKAMGHDDVGRDPSNDVLAFVLRVEVENALPTALDMHYSAEHEGHGDDDGERPEVVA